MPRGTQKSKALAVLPADGFDYGAIVPAAADQLREHAEKVRGIGLRAAGELRQVAGRTAVAIGRELAKAKKLVRGDGKLWTSWVEHECGLKIGTAQNMMRVAESAAGKNANVFAFSVLPASALYEVCRRSTPATVVKNIEARLETGDVPSIREIKLMIAAAKPTKKAKTNARAQSSGKARFLALADKVLQLAKYDGPVDADVTEAAHKAANILFDLKIKLYDALSKQQKRHFDPYPPKLRVIDGERKH